MHKRLSISFFLAVMVLLPVQECCADIYKYVDEKGVIHLTNMPTHKKYRLVLKDVRDSAPAPRDCKEYDHIISPLCEQYSVDKALVKAIIKAESDFDPYAVSKKGAQGLMQLMPEKARELKVSDPFDPRENLKGGISHFRRLLDKFNHDIPLALAAYNAGENAVISSNAIPPFKETQEYVKKVLEYKKYFQMLR